MILDFETYSEAGCVWTGEKWVGPPGAPKNSKGLGVVGVVNYTQHLTFEVLVACYDLLDGAGVRTWRPGEPPPADLFAYVARGGLIEAHNVSFERRVWQACERLYGWPPLPPLSQWRCSAAKSRAWSRPGGLDAAAHVAGTPPKDPAGSALIRDLTMPRKPTKAQPAMRLTREIAPDKFDALDRYCAQDVIAERALSEATPDLSPQEQEYWLVDQAINERGVAVDLATIDAGIRILDEALARYGERVKALTGGIAATEVAQLMGWCARLGWPMPALDEEAIAEALDAPGCPPLVREVLRLRATIASASVKKLYALRNTATAAGRVHDLFIFHGARTGRPTGDGPQPTNLPKAGPNVWRCRCGRHYGASVAGCPWCGVGSEGRIDHKGRPLPPDAKPQEWSPEAMEEAIAVARSGSLDVLEMYFGEALLTLAGCLRGMFVAAPGHDLVSSDWTAIEAVVLACLSGEQWRIDLFREGGKIYEASGAKVGGVPYESLLEHKARTGQHHPLRQTGKTCFAADTQVLTDSGTKAIVDVLSTDKVWDGQEWVSHSGCIAQGVREVISLGGVKMTPDHKISTGRSWQEAKRLVSNGKIRSRSLAHALGSFPWSALTEETAGALKRLWSPVIAEQNRTGSRSRICVAERRRDATDALKRRRASRAKIIGNTRMSSLTTSTVAGFSIASQRRLAGATVPETRLGRTTAGAASRFLRHGASPEKVAGNSCGTSSGCPDGTGLNSTWTGSIQIGGMSRGISDSYRGRRIKRTREKFKTCNENSTNFAPVFDLVNAGPRRRFTIITNDGPLIVSNCELALGYQGWVGSWRAFDAKTSMTDDDIKQIILAWRAASPAIVEFWGGQSRNRRTEEFYGVEGAFIQAILSPGSVFDVRGLKFQMLGDALYITLLSGRRLTYHAPRLHASEKYGQTYGISYWGWNTNPKNGPRGWINIRTWGGRLVENIVQATANDILRFTSVNLERAGYPIVLHVYDEIVCEVPEGVGSVEELEAWMKYLPPWARCADGQRWPVGAAGGWRGKRYRKG